MNIKQLNRNKFQKYIRPLFIKEKCDICGATDKLELHHDKQFDEILRESINILNLDYRENIEDYTKEELKQISLVLLGLQVKIKYYTLCDKCHINIHEDGGRSIYDYICKINKNNDIQGYINNILIPYMNGILNKKLYSDDKEYLQYMFFQCNLKNRTMGINSLNKLLLQYNIPYVILNERDKNGRWWIIKRI